MYKIIELITSTFIFGSAIFYLGKKFYFINSVKKKKFLDKETQTEYNIDNPTLNKTTEIDNEILASLDKEIIDKTPEKYSWYFI